MNKFFTALFLCVAAIGVSATPATENPEFPITCNLKWNFISGDDDKILLTKKIRSPSWLFEGMVLKNLSSEFCIIRGIETDVETATQEIFIGYSRILAKEYRLTVIEKMQENGWVVAED